MNVCKIFVEMYAYTHTHMHTYRFYEKMQYRDCTIEAWDKLQNARDRYRSMAGPVGMHKVCIYMYLGFIVHTTHAYIYIHTHTHI
jgi:hypothetical protein